MTKKMYTRFWNKNSKKLILLFGEEMLNSVSLWCQINFLDKLTPNFKYLFDKTRNYRFYFELLVEITVTQ